MGRVKIVDRSGQFSVAALQGMDRALNKMIVDIERLAKQVVPHDQGPLSSSGRHERKGFLRHRVIFDKEYAAAIEAGQMTVKSMRRVKTKDGWITLKPGVYKLKPRKPGKKIHYLRDSGNEIAAKADEYFKREGVTVTIA